MNDIIIGGVIVALLVAGAVFLARRKPGKGRAGDGGRGVDRREQD